jgi:DNA-binding MarR family transcriptional regulator
LAVVKEESISPALAGRLGYLLSTAANGVRERTEAALLPLDLTPKLLGALDVLLGEGPMSQVELAKRLRVDRTTMVDIIDGLEQRYFVERTLNPEDRRRYLVTVTRRGEQVHRRASAAADEVQGSLLAALSPKDVERLRQLLISLIHASSEK